MAHILAREFARSFRSRQNLLRRTGDCRRTLRVEQLEPRQVLAAAVVPHEILVQFTADADQAARNAVHGRLGAAVLDEIRTPVMAAAGAGVLERLALSGGNVDAAIASISKMPGVAFAEPNWLYTTQVESNDPYYTNGNLWGMYSSDTPAAAGPVGTTNFYGSQAEQAWAGGDVGSHDVYVGIIDEGYQYTHPDLANNAWTNPFDPVDGVDNDNNGYVDDIHGWDFYSNNNSVYDGTADDHGTHVAGTIGAQGGNDTGVAGINWQVTMISAKFLGPRGGYLSDAIEALDYLTGLKKLHPEINIVATNNSWGGGGFSQSLLDAIARAAKEEILFVAAAGNNSSNNDASASYPSNYSTLGQTGGSGDPLSYDSVIAVASIASNGTLSSFSNYGSGQVDLGAPGSAIYSTLPTNSYGSYSGTSMATPHVTGTAALYAAKYPSASAEQIREAILASTTPTASLDGRTATGGRLNTAAALQFAPVGSSLRIDDVTVEEGDSGSQIVNFTVTRVGDVTGEVTVHYATADGTAKEGTDYQAAAGTLTIPDGIATGTISVMVNGDTDYELDEVFSVNLSNASNAYIIDSQGIGTIRNDDAQPPPSIGISISDVTKNEGNRKTTSFTFTVTRSGSTSGSVSFTYATENGTASANSDYVATSGSKTIRSGSTSTTITVKVYGDRVAELDETFFVNLVTVSSNASILDDQGVGTILNDDAGAVSSGVLYLPPVADDEDEEEAVDLESVNSEDALIGSPASGPLSTVDWYFASPADEILYDDGLSW